MNKLILILLPNTSQLFNLIIPPTPIDRKRSSFSASLSKSEMKNCSKRTENDDLRMKKIARRLDFND